jgi:D-galacturonate reductase
MRALRYNDVSADRNTVAVVQAMEAILAEHAAGRPGAVVEVNGSDGGLVLRIPGRPESLVLYAGRV